MNGIVRSILLLVALGSSGIAAILAFNAAKEYQRHETLLSRFGAQSQAAIPRVSAQGSKHDGLDIARYRNDPWSIWTASFQRDAPNVLLESLGLPVQTVIESATWKTRPIRFGATFVHDAAAVDFLNSLESLPGRLQVSRCTLKRVQGAVLSCEAKLSWME